MSGVAHPIRIQTVQNSLTTFEQHMLPCVNCKQMLIQEMLLMSHKCYLQNVT